MSRRLTTEVFVQRSVEKHGDLYDYSKVDYVNHNTEVCIICPVHGEFWQLPYSHMTMGHGCKQCADTKNGENIRRDFDKYKEEVSKIHNDFYDYSKSVYIKGTIPIEIICPNHGSFWQTPNGHKTGRGCKKCAQISKINKTSFDYKKFLEKAFTLYGHRFEYPNIETNYVNMNTEIPILCREHGVYNQKPRNHLNGHCCRKCSHSVSKPELEVQEFVKSLGVEIESNTRQIIKPLELDVYIPSLKKAIEFNGEWWHYNPKNPECRGEAYHENKTRLCLEKDIELLHIRESDWKNNRPIIENQIKDLLNINK